MLNAHQITHLEDGKANTKGMFVNLITEVKMSHKVSTKR